MSALAFPSTPSVNDTFTSAGRSWKWTGTRWAVVATTISPSRLTGEGAELGDVLSWDGENYSPVPISFPTELPAPPLTGTHTLKSINGVLTWVAD
jgi:hypothetical protein